MYSPYTAPCERFFSLSQTTVQRFLTAAHQPNQLFCPTAQSTLPSEGQFCVVQSPTAHTALRRVSFTSTADNLGRSSRPIAFWCMDKVTKLFTASGQLYFSRLWNYEIICDNKTKVLIAASAATDPTTCACVFSFALLGASQLATVCTKIPPPPTRLRTSVMQLPLLSFQHIAATFLRSQPTTSHFFLLRALGPTFCSIPPVIPSSQ
jgi:hypothetical protein